ncbi:MAG: ketopantoate reductase family protein [Pseudomonadota bacterium]|nr:ketopantoate reductase family protein [Pseudomonadota bacterium]
MAHREFAILGAGAIGSILGAHLAAAGHSVVMLARNLRARQIQKNGLHIAGLTDLTVEVDVLSDPAQFRGADVLIVAMKTPGTRAALEPYRHHDISVAFSIQNGLEKNLLLAEIFTARRVLGALADTSGEMQADGVVVFTRNVNLMLGELDGPAGERAHRIAGVIDRSGVRAEAADDIQSLEWSKFCAWAGLVAISVTTRAVTSEFLADPGSARVLARLIRELAAVARAAGARLTDRSVLPVASLAAGSEQDAVGLLMDIGTTYRQTAPRHRLSSLQDLEAGRPLEFEAALGCARRKAEELRIPCPLLDAFYHLVAGLDRMHTTAAPK